MDKTILKNFAIESRKELMEKIDRKIKLFYLNEEFKKENRGDVIFLSNDKHTLTLTREEESNREKLIKRIVELGYEQVVEEAAYTWFNRIVAIRYMEIHDYLPLTKENQSLGIRVLSSNENTPNPEILKFSNLNNSELDINFDKDFYSKLNSEDEKFKYVIKLICDKLGSIIPQVFDGITDYIDLLIPDNMLLENGFVYKLINNINIENFEAVEIIGWLYQYYNQAEKDKAMSNRKTYSKDEIPYVTQLFTPEWIVRFMVENTLGNLYINSTGDNEFSRNLKYYVKDNKQLNNVNNFNIERISFIDPCSGSGHILVYAFDVFYKIYENLGYNKKDISKLILKNNLYGLDIDDRAFQLTLFSVLLKARQFDKDLFNENIISNLNITSINENSSVLESYLELIDNTEIKEKLMVLINQFTNAKEIGSLLKIELDNYDDIEDYLEKDNTIFSHDLKLKFLPFIKAARILTKKYDIYVTNPPYLNADSMNPILKKYINTNYSNYKQDLYASFMGVDLLKENGLMGMIDQHGWMFLTTFEKTRVDYLNNYSLQILLHLGPRSFEEIGGEVVQNSCFISKKTKINNESLFFRLIDYKSPKLKEEQFLKSLLSNENVYHFNNSFSNIPGSPISYWLNDAIIEDFKKATLLGDLLPVKKGMDSGNNSRFMRFWYEVDYNKTVMSNNDKTKKWVCYNKGGQYQKWYGNNYYVINWENNGEELRNSTANLRSEHLYFKPSITWTAMGNCTFRLSYPLSIFDSSGSSMFPSEYQIYGILAFCNSNVMNVFLDILNPTLSSGAGTISNLPIIEDSIYNCDILNKSKENVELVKKDWNNKEISWGFEKNPLLNRSSSIEDSLNQYINEIENDRRILKENEEFINEYFVKIYNLDKKIICVEDKNISIRMPKEIDLIKDLISYSVGCMFGRYSLEKNGLILAGGAIDNNKYNIFKPDDDNIIPISDNPDVYYNDDIVCKFKEFIKSAFGIDNLNKNLDFIAGVLGKRGTESSEETIRRYFVNDFYNDHVKMYQKRPIYWLFDSGIKNGFKCLIYLHRYNEQIVSKIRTKYLHNTLSVYQRTVEEIDYKLNNEELSTTNKRELQNKKVDINNKITECNEYEEMVGNVANKMIKLDLDDGVSVNYAKFVDDNDKSILAKIK